MNAERKAQFDVTQKENEANAARYKLEQAQRDQVALAERLARERKEQSIRANNSAIYFKVKKFVDDHPQVVLPPLTEKSWNPNREWEFVTRPFRTGLLLSRTDHSTILDFLGRAIKHEPYKSDASFSQAIDELKKWDLSNSW